MININIKTERLEVLKRLSKQVRPAIREGMRKLSLQAEQFAKTKSYDASGLKVGTGTLRRSITSYYDQVGDYTEGGIYSNVVYARIHEFGGVIYPVNAKLLKFKINGQWRSAHSVTIPARPYMEPAIRNNWATLLNTAADEIKRQLEK